MSYLRRMKQERTRALSEHDLLRIEEVAVEIGKNKADVETWLSSHGLIHTVLGKRRVIWGDVLRLIRGSSPSKLPPTQKSCIPMPLSDEF